MARSLILFATITLVVAAGAQAWESDVHYGLTYWLALQAGFTDDAARVVAEADLSLDRGIRAAPVAVGVYACRGDYGASRDVRDNHFPTDVNVPNPPERREVVANSAAARRRALDEANRKIDPKYGNAQSESLGRFGEGLHPLQDSWSHQGETRRAHLALSPRLRVVAPLQPGRLVEPLRRPGLRVGRGRSPYGESHVRDDDRVPQVEPLGVDRTATGGMARRAEVVAHAMLVTIYHQLTRQTTYHDPGTDYYDRRHAERLRRRALQTLERQGYRVTLEPAA